MTSDHVDGVLDRWQREQPEIDPSPLAVTGRIARLAVLLERELEPILAQHAVSAGEFDVLASLRRNGDPYRLTPTALSETLMVTSGGMTKRLSSLEGAGLIRRVPDPDDRRSRAVELTGAGQRLVERIATAHLKNEKRLLGGLGKRQRRDLAAGLRELCLALGDEAAAAARKSRRRS